MNRQFNAKTLVVRTALAVLTVMIYVALTGCNKELARMEQNQLEMQQLIQLNTQLMTDNMNRIENHQTQLHVSIEDVQKNTRKQTDDMIAVIGQEHAALRDMLQIQNQRLTNSIVGIERNQGTLHSGVEGLNTNVQRVDGSTAGLEKNLLKMEQTLQNNNKELANLIDVIGQRQLRSEERNQDNLQMMVGTLKDVQQNQARLQEQLTLLQDKSQETNSKVIAALEQMKITLSQLQAQISLLSPGENTPSSEIKK